jgi:hypothetical protein
MRRVVGDQIKALSELSEIINRHGKSFDLSSPALGEPRAARMEAVSAEPVSVVAPAISDAVGQSRYATERRPNGANVQPIAKMAPRAVPRQSPTVLRNAAATDDSSEGWVSDLLRRASTDEETSTPVVERHQTEPAPAPQTVAAANGNGAAQAAAAPPAPAPAAVSGLGAISADIARAIDHDAAVELWERHRKGERNLFTRRLYTLPGQQTFDEIRRKYQRDGDFRTAVDRYVADFEKLLAEVTKAGKDRAAGGAYLVSDTGKVYTMLAHASGRFD